MTRAKRHFIPGHIWHITHRRHKKKFLFKFDKDKKRFVEWLFQAKKHSGDSLLNSNNEHDGG